MKNHVRVYISLPADAVFEQVHDDYSGRVISTTVEADLNLGEVNMALCELENALRELAWEDKDGD